MDNIEWTDPPQPRGGRKGTLFSADVRNALRSRPGEWARIATGKHASSARRYAKRHPEYEVTTRQNPDKTFAIYARFVGEQS